MVDGRAGVKISNVNPGNQARGFPRASGLTVLFDAETGLAPFPSRVRN